PRVVDGIMRSDGATNLGADDAAGVAIILAAVEALRERGRSHPPLLLLFTVGEEVGLVGAKAFDPAPWGAREGIVFDNAGEAGVVVTRGATYIAFDVAIHGAGGHPGKRLEGAVSAIEIFRQARYPFGSLDNDTTRISVGSVTAGSARNAVPRELRALGEIRTLADAAGREALMAQVARAFTGAATALGGAAEVTFDPHCDCYTVAEDEPLLLAWRAAVEARGGEYRTMTTFIGSDTSALRPGVRIFTVSTGVMDEHTVDEWVPLAPLAELAETAVDLLVGWPQEREGGGR
ncbi:MAG: M20/M25/M40 family metallo-hydrolase, partial [Chloroflexota bacterium]|nr:M20/M25/M40 family metallo-hydrolase [Chloroflexota bacterium]